MEYSVWLVWSSFLLSLANTAGWADDRMEEIKNRETSCEAVITNQSSISGGMAMANKDRYFAENSRVPVPLKMLFFPLPWTVVIKSNG